MERSIFTGGELVGIQCDDACLTDLIREGADGLLQSLDAPPTVSVVVERNRAPFRTAGWSTLTRGAWHRGGAVVVRDVCTSGLDLHARVVAGVPELVFRWRPPSTTRAAAVALPARAHLLARAVLLQYPVLWWAGTRQRVPLHGSALDANPYVAVIGGGSGVGKSTLLARELEAGAVASSDNLCVTDGRVVWGIVEPVRLEGGSGRRMTHGRRETHLRARVPVVVPNVVVLLCRSANGQTSVRRCSSRDAGRELAAGTYTAGELRRFWPFAALLAMGTGVGPVHPPVTALCRVLADGVDTFDVAVTSGLGERLGQLLEQREESLV